MHMYNLPSVCMHIQYSKGYSSYPVCVRVRVGVGVGVRVRVRVHVHVLLVFCYQVHLN